MLPDRIREVLVAVDFGDASAHAVALGGLLASGADARLVVLHAESVDVPPYFTVRQIAEYEAEIEAARSEARQFLQRFAAQNTAWPAEARVVEARPAEAILDAAHGADLVLMGTHGRRGPSRWWLGSVAERVVGACAAPVLVVHEDEAPVAATEVFARTVVITGGRDVGAVAPWVASLAAPYGGQVSVADTIELALPDVATATLVVVAQPPAGERHGFDPGPLLRECRRPTLFVRAEEAGVEPV